MEPGKPRLDNTNIVRCLDEYYGICAMVIGTLELISLLINLGSPIIVYTQLSNDPTSAKADVNLQFIASMVGCAIDLIIIPLLMFGVVGKKAVCLIPHGVYSVRCTTGRLVNHF